MTSDLIKSLVVCWDSVGIATFCLLSHSHFASTFIAEYSRDKYCVREQHFLEKVLKAAAVRAVPSDCMQMELQTVSNSVSSGIILS